MEDRNKTLGEFYLKNYRMFCKRVSNRAGGGYNAEDVVQEAFSRALLYWSSFNPEYKALGAWFNTILNNTLKDFTQAERMIGMSMEFDEELHEGIGMSQTSAHTMKRIKHMINGKRDGTKECLTLYFLNGYTCKEVCHVTDMKPKAVSMAVLRFKQEVKEKLGV